MASICNLVFVAVVVVTHVMLDTSR